MVRFNVVAFASVTAPENVRLPVEAAPSVTDGELALKVSPLAKFRAVASLWTVELASKLIVLEPSALSLPSFMVNPPAPPRPTVFVTPAQMALLLPERASVPPPRNRKPCAAEALPDTVILFVILSVDPDATLILVPTCDARLKLDRVLFPLRFCKEPFEVVPAPLNETEFDSEMLPELPLSWKSPAVPVSEEFPRALELVICRTPAFSAVVPL